MMMASLSSLLWIALALVAGTILLEVWFAHRRLNEQMARLQFFLDDLDEDIREE